MFQIKFKKIDKSNHIPAYYQLKEAIHTKIKDGEIQPGERLLSENQLSELFNVSRMTVRKATDQLVEEGLLLREQGKGTFVKKINYDKIERDLSQLSSLTSDLGRSKYKIVTTVLKEEVVSASKEIAGRLDINTGDKVIKLARLRESDSQPIIWETSFIPFKVCPRLIEEDLNGSLFSILEEKYGLKISDANASIEAMLADEFIAEMLQMGKNQPVVKVEQVTYLSDGRAIQFVVSFSRGDKYKYYVHRKRING